jgi:hypothetical protein
MKLFKLTEYMVNGCHPMNTNHTFVWAESRDTLALKMEEYAQKNRAHKEAVEKQDEKAWMPDYHFEIKEAEPKELVVMTLEDGELKKDYPLVGQIGNKFFP